MLKITFISICIKILIKIRLSFLFFKVFIFTFSINKIINTVNPVHLRLSLKANVNKIFLNIKPLKRTNHKLFNILIYTTIKKQKKRMLLCLNENLKFLINMSSHFLLMYCFITLLQHRYSF